MSTERLSKILNKLQTQHTGGAQLSPEEWQQQQCDWSNDIVGNLNEHDGYNCEICKNKGSIYFIKENEYNGQKEMYQRECRCMSIRRTLSKAQRSGLGNVLSDCTFAKFETPEEWQRIIKEKAQAFCGDDSSRWFYIGGQTGAGKSHICTAIAGHYIKKGYNCRYMLWRDDAVKLKASVNDFEKYQPLIDEFKKVDVLYIDDFLKTQQGTAPTMADINLAFELLNYRLLDKDKITIISSEFTIETALELDEATIGRVYQQSGGYRISIEKDINKNYRLRG